MQQSLLISDAEKAYEVIREGFFQSRIAYEEYSVLLGESAKCTWEQSFCEWFLGLGRLESGTGPGSESNRHFSASADQAAERFASNNMPPQPKDRTSGLDHWLQSLEAKTETLHHECHSVAHRDPALLLALQDCSHGPACYFCRYLT